MKKILSAALTLAMTLSLLPAAFAAGGTAYASTQAVEVDGKKVEFQMYALKDANGNPTNYVKLRDVAHVLNGTKAQFSVGYDGAISVTTGTAYTDAGGEMTTPYSGDRAYRTGSGAVKVNGQEADLESIILTDDAGGDYTYFKLRDLGAALGFQVDWSAERGVFLNTGSAPAEDGKITLADLQGVWTATMAPYDWKLSPREFIISGDQYTWAVIQGTNNQIINGTITEFDNDFQGDIEGVNYVLYFDGMRYVLENDGSIQSSGDSQYYSGGSKLQIRTINLAENYIQDTTGYRYERRASSSVCDQVQVQLNAALDWLAERDPINDFLVKYVTTNGKMTTYGDFKGQYACYLDILGSLGTNKDWTYQIYADPDTGLVTLRASIYSGGTGAYAISGATSYTLELSPDGGPYRGSFSDTVSTSSSIMGSWSYSGTFQIDPASFTDWTEALTFDSYDGSDQSFDAKNGAVNVQIMLKALRNEILKPNGYKLSDLGFTHF